MRNFNSVKHQGKPEEQVTLQGKADLETDPSKRKEVAGSCGLTQALVFFPGNCLTFVGGTAGEGPIFSCLLLRILGSISFWKQSEQSFPEVFWSDPKRPVPINP